jgi:uncharacterized membrane protein YbhN (UPF0104 family)
VWRIVWRIARWVLFAAVLYYVFEHGRKLWSSVGPAPIHIDWPWLVASGMAAIVGWSLSAIYWRRLLADWSISITAMQAIRAYFVGGLGKYVPGKAMVVVLRSGMVSRNRHEAAAAAFSVLRETLSSMAVGVVWSVAGGPWLMPLIADALPSAWSARAGDLFSGWSTATHVAWMLVVASLGLVALELFAAVLDALARRLLPAAVQSAEVAPATRRRTWSETAAGYVLLSAGWWLQGLSLGLTLRAISHESWTLGDWPMWTTAASASTVLGFVVVIAPGGLGPREWAIMQLLSGSAGGSQAVLAAVLLRGVVLAGEVVASAALYGFPLQPVDRSGPASIAKTTS